MKWEQSIMPVFALLSASMCLAQGERPAPDPVQRAVTEARNAGRLADAEQLLRNGIRDLEQSDPQSLRLPQYMRELAVLVGRSGKSEEAAALYERAYEIDRNAFAPNDLRMTVDISNLAWAAHAARNDQEADRLFNQSLDIVRANAATLQSSQDFGYAASALGTVISFYTLEKRWVDAEVLMPQEVKLCDKILETYRPGYGACGNISGLYEQIYRGEGRTAEAEQLPHVEQLPADLAALNRTAHKYAKDGLFPSAEDTYNRAIAVAQKLETNPEFMYQRLEVGEMESLGALYQLEGQNDRAEKIYLSAFELTKKRAETESDSGHAMFAAALGPSSLVELYRSEGRLKDAERLLQSVLAIQQTQLGEHNRAVVNTMTSLASLYQEDGRKEKDRMQYMQARVLYERAISIQERNLGPDHREMISLLDQYADLLGELPDTAKEAEVRARIATISAANPQR